MSSAVYATDASDAKRVFMCRSRPMSDARALWRNRRKKGGYVRVFASSETVFKKLDPDHEGFAEIHKLWWQL